MPVSTRTLRTPCSASVRAADSASSLSQAFNTLARAIAEAGVNVGLYKTPETISKSVNRRVRAELKRLAVLLRRLIRGLGGGLRLALTSHRWRDGPLLSRERERGFLSSPQQSRGDAGFTPSPSGRGGTRAREGVGGEGLALGFPPPLIRHDQRSTKHDFGMTMHDLP